MPGERPVAVFTYWLARVKALASAAVSKDAEPMAEADVMKG